MFIYKCDLCKREIKDSKEMVTAAIGHGTGYCFCAGCGKPIVGVLRKLKLLQPAATKKKRSTGGTL